MNAELLNMILTLLAALAGYGGLRWVFRESIEKVKNEMKNQNLQKIIEEDEHSKN